jgi:hypothetical protein
MRPEELCDGKAFFHALEKFRGMQFELPTHGIRITNKDPAFPFFFIIRTASFVRFFFS